MKGTDETTPSPDGGKGQKGTPSPALRERGGVRATST